jgi:hypothetical protein
MRCHLDRPGELGPLERTDPHPYQYICAACHDEVYRDFPPDLIENIERMAAHDRQSLVIEKALGRPSMLMAEKLVLSKLSSLAPDLPPLPETRKTAAFANLQVALPPPSNEEIEISADAGSLDERLYIELLFDWRSVRHNW